MTWKNGEPTPDRTFNERVTLTEVWCWKQAKPSLSQLRSRGSRPPALADYMRQFMRTTGLDDVARCSAPEINCRAVH